MKRNLTRFSTVCASLVFIAVTFGVVAPNRLLAEIRLNEIQVIGTHNSYHVEPHPSMMQMIRNVIGKRADAIAYTHKPLPEQFERLGIRQIELDVYADPKGGHFANPKGPQMVAEAKLPLVPEIDPDNELDEPGLKILHSPGVDFFTTVRTFTLALKQVKAWSDANPNHLPIMILVEVKEDRIMPIFKTPLPSDAAAFDAIDREILSVFDKSRIITPDSVRGDAKTLREAVLKTGWPTLKAARGKVIFALDNPGKPRDAYLKGHSSLEGRMLFVDNGTSKPSSAFLKYNDPVRDFKRIQSAVKEGFLVRTRADVETEQARQNDASRRDKALASGAQFVSTDYPEPNAALSKYSVQLPDDAIARSNPVNGDGSSIVTIQKK